MKRMSLTLIIVILISGCASIFPTTRNYDIQLNNWVGKHVDDLVKSWGPPQNSYKLSDKGTVIEFYRSRIENIIGLTMKKKISLRLIHYGAKPYLYWIKKE
jgi:hypothetical protein